LAVQPVAPADLPAVIEMLGELAAYEESDELVRGTPESLHTAMFGATPLLCGFIARRANESAGVILGSYGYSTFAARPRLFIEDLIVRAHCRGGGVGRALIAAFARHCVERNCAGLRWRVLAGNAPAIRFYGSIGALISSQRLDCSLDGDALRALAKCGGATPSPIRFAAGDGRFLNRSA
jgi:ribosomal protein S18 acetylase RimI-like enzyme